MCLCACARVWMTYNTCTLWWALLWYPKHDGRWNFGWRCSCLSKYVWTWEPTLCGSGLLGMRQITIEGSVILHKWQISICSNASRDTFHCFSSLLLVLFAQISWHRSQTIASWMWPLVFWQQHMSMTISENCPCGISHHFTRYFSVYPVNSQRLFITSLALFCIVRRKYAHLM